MKKTLALAILGVATVSNTFGQGAIIFDNYAVGASYKQIAWGPGTAKNGQAVVDALEIQLYYGAGVVSDLSLMTAGVTTSIVPGIGYDPGEGKGGGGYFTGPVQIISAWTPGSTWTFSIQLVDESQYKMEPNFWQETAAVTSSATPNNPLASFPGVQVVPVPEPSTFALAGLGAAALLIFRRRA